jgi:hypothetical protein
VLHVLSISSNSLWVQRLVLDNVSSKSDLTGDNFMK